MAIEPNTAPVPAAQVQTGVWFHVFTVLGLLSVAFAAMFGAAFLEGWGVYAAIKEEHLKIEALRNLMLAAGAAGAVIAGVLGLALAAVRTSALDSQAKTAVKDSKLSEKKHADDTDLAQRRHQSEAFAKAIEQLGHENFAVRLGAVYALEALAKSSKELHGPIFETLCAYVRNQAPAKGIADLSLINKTDIRRSINNLLELIDPPNVVVQAILTVIGRRDPKRDPQEGFRLDLRDTNLRKADLNKGHFESANLRGAHLEGAVLGDVHLERADLRWARLEGANLIEAHLERANLWNAHFEGANLRGGHLERVDLWDAHLERANLRGAHLERANLMDAHLEGAYLDEAHLESAYLIGVRLEGAILRDIFFNAQTNVSGASFLNSQGIPAKPGNDFRATVSGANTAQWPDGDDAKAWDRGEDDDEIPF